MTRSVVRGELAEETFHYPCLTFLGGSYTKTAELAALDTIIDASDYQSTLTGRDIAVLQQRSGFLPEIFQAWSSVYNTSTEKLMVPVLPAIEL